MQLPGELFQEAVSVEYILQQPVRAPPAFVLVLDLSQSMEALAVRTSLDNTLICKPVMPDLMGKHVCMRDM